MLLLVSSLPDPRPVPFNGIGVTTMRYMPVRFVKRLGSRPLIRPFTHTVSWTTVPFRTAEASLHGVVRVGVLVALRCRLSPLPWFELKQGRCMSFLIRVYREFVVPFGGTSAPYARFPYCEAP